MSPRVSIVIPHRNGTELLEDCLEALLLQDFRDFETIVVDNGSSDDSVEFLRTRYSWVQILDLGKNLGFAGGCNEGIRSSRGELVVLLNNDTRAESTWLSALVRALDEYPEAGFAASKVLLAEPPHLIDSAGDWYSYKAGVPFNLGAGEPKESCEETSWVFGASAAASIYRRSMLDVIGLFDEDFFYIMEDVDLDFRAQLAGYGCLYVHDAVVLHKRGVSLRDRSPEVRGIILRNLVWTAGKNLPWSLLAVTVAYAVVRSVRWVGWRAKRRLRGFRDYAPGHFRQGRHAIHFFRAVVTLLPKRWRTQRLRRVSTNHLRELLNEPRRPPGERRST